MNPDSTQQSSVKDQGLQKLEEDLKNLEQPSATSAFTNSVTNNPPVNFPNPNVTNKKASSLMLLAVLLVVAALLATLGYVLFMQFVGGKNVLPITPKACTTEAKICPDGSGVGRTGPNCEFAVCPTINPGPIETPIELQSMSTALPSGTPSANPRPTPNILPSATPMVY